MDTFNVMPNKIHVLSTDETIKTKVDGYEYDHYPDLDGILDDPDLKGDVVAMEEKVLAMYDETLQISNLHLEGLDGDYDGIILCRTLQ